jgi:energy-coupling factor transporter ATP-binding protein EcfA2
MAIHPDIVAWIAGREHWQQEALARLAAGKSLSTKDVADIVEMCVDEHRAGYKAPDPPAYDAAPSGNTDSIANNPAVTLTCAKNLQNVNALRPDQDLSIESSGLTVVYGENGTGKSGYVRFLKQACRARGGPDVIYPNVYTEESATQTGVLEYAVNGDPREFVWESGAAIPSELREVSVFDSRSAAVYITGENEVAYLPHGMDLLPRLGVVADEVARRLTIRQGELQHALDKWQDVQINTKVFELLDALHVRANAERLKELATLNATDVDRLEELRNLDRKYKADNPAQRAKELRVRANRLRDIRERLLSCESALSADAARRWGASLDFLGNARKAAELAAASAFEDAPVQGVGSEPWRALWEAARAFAESGAVPVQQYPPVEGAICVLCQQQIDSVAADRAKRFEEFIRSTTERDVRRAESLVAKERAGIEDKAPRMIADVHALQEIASLDASTGEALHTSIVALSRRRDALLRCTTLEEAAAVGLVSEGPETKLREARERAEAEAETFEAAANADEVKANEAELRELEARGQLKGLIPRIDEQVARYEELGVLKRAIAAASTRSITLKNNEMMQLMVTDPLANAFAGQCEALRLQHIPIGMQARGAKAQRLHSLALEEAEGRDAAPEAVLSEGESRAIALAAFFAEVDLQESKSTLVFDDPVSSLDHGRREYVARQVAAVARQRPALVFTHDLVFLWLLQGAAEEAGVEVTPRVFRRSAAGSGLVANDWPWDGLKVTPRIGALRQDLVRLKKVEADQPDVYEREIRWFYGKLRSTWERAVEEVLFQNAVRRFDTSVRTQSLKGIHKVTEAELKTLEEGMTKTSAWIEAHDHSPALSLPVPSVAEATKDLDSLEAWVKQIKGHYK